MLNKCQDKNLREANVFDLPYPPVSSKNIYMEQKHDEYDFFLRALKDYDSREERGFKTRLSIDAGISAPYLTQILKKRRRAGFETQVAIADALGWDYYKFLEYGRSLILVENSKKPDRKPVHSNARIVWPAEVCQPESDYNESNKPKAKEDDSSSQSNKDKLRPIRQQHVCLIDLFPDQEEAYEINKKLLEIKKADPARWDRVKEYIELQFAQIDAKKIAGENSE